MDIPFVEYNFSAFNRMCKVFSIAFLMLFSPTIYAQEDTLKVNFRNLGKDIIDTVETSSGKKVKYYYVYDNQIVRTDRTTIDYVKQCMRQKIKPSLILIRNREEGDSIVIE